MATNTLITNDVVLKEAMMHLENELVISKLCDRDFEPEFGGSGAKNGDTIRIARPVRGQVRTGNVMQAQDITEGRETLTVATQIGADLEFTSKDLTLSVDKFSERILKPQMSILANTIDIAVYTELVNATWNWVGTPGQTINSFTDFALAPERLDHMSVPRERNACLSPSDQWGMLGSFAGLYIQDTAKSALVSAKLPRVGGVEMYMSQNVITHTNGNWSATAMAITGATLSTTYASAKDSYTIDLQINGLTASTGTVKKGDVFTIDSVYAVNPVNRQTRNFLQPFVVKADATADSNGVATVTVSPPIIITGPYITCSAAAVVGGAVTFKGTKATAYDQSVVFHRNAITLAMPPMIKPQGAAWCEQRSFEGINLRLIQGYDMTNDIPQWRFDLLYGTKAYQPNLATRVSGT